MSPICERALGRIDGRCVGMKVWGDLSFVPSDHVHLDGKAGDLKTNGGGVPLLGRRHFVSFTTDAVCPFMISG